MVRKYNFIYSALIKGDDDLVGHIAYSIYKSKKVAFIKDFKDQKLKEPSESDLESFHDTSRQHLDSYLLEAKEILHTYTQATLSDYATGIENQAKEKVATARQNYITKLETSAERMKPRFWPGVIQSLVGSIGFTFFLGFLCIVLFGAVHGIDGITSLAKEVLNASFDQASILPPPDQ